MAEAYPQHHQEMGRINASDQSPRDRDEKTCRLRFFEARKTTGAMITQEITALTKN
jgi:hypothetical protein